MFLDFDTKQLFGRVAQISMTTAMRHINSKDKKNRIKHVNEKHDCLQAQNFFSRLSGLKGNGPCLPTELESIDKAWVRASIVGEARYKRKDHNVPFTAAIAAADCPIQAPSNSAPQNGEVHLLACGRGVPVP